MITEHMKNTRVSLFSRLMVIYSPAGGNGKSEIAANLAYMLAKAGKRIWIIDANTYAPTLDLIFQCHHVPGSFVRFICSKKKEDFPIYPLNSFSGHGVSTLYLTPAGNGDRKTRRDILDKSTVNDDFIARMLDKINQNIIRHRIDLCIIDTHPGFEDINNVWFGLTSFLLLVSRMNDLDLRNLGLLLQDINVTDIEKKLVVFNNVQYKDERVSHDIENQEMLEKFRDFISGDEIKKELTGSFTCNGNLCGTVEFFCNPFLYSKELSIYQQRGERISLFSEQYPDDVFSIRIRELALFISSRYMPDSGM